MIKQIQYTYSRLTPTPPSPPPKMSVLSTFIEKTKTGSCPLSAMVPLVHQQNCSFSDGCTVNVCDFLHNLSSVTTVLHYSRHFSTDSLHVFSSRLISLSSELLNRLSDQKTVLLNQWQRVRRVESIPRCPKSTCRPPRARCLLTPTCSLMTCPWIHCKMNVSVVIVTVAGS